MTLSTCSSKELNSRGRAAQILDYAHIIQTANLPSMGEDTHNPTLNPPQLNDQLFKMNSQNHNHTLQPTN